MNFIPEQEPQQAAGADEAPDLGEADTTFVTSEGGEAKPKNNSMMVLLGLVVVGATVVWFMYFRKGPQAASAADVAGPDTVTTFLASGEEHVQLMKQMLQSTDKVVQRFRAYPSQTQVPVTALRTNPFRRLAAKSAPESESASAARRRQEEERQAAAAAVQSLHLQSVMQGKTYQACMINNKLCQVGQEVDGFTVDEINRGAVVVRNGSYRFELSMQK